MGSGKDRDPVLSVTLNPIAYSGLKKGCSQMLIGEYGMTIMKHRR